MSIEERIEQISNDSIAEATEIPSERLISLAEKLVERVQNA